MISLPTNNLGFAPEHPGIHVGEHLQHAYVFEKNGDGNRRDGRGQVTKGASFEEYIGEVESAISQASYVQTSCEIDKGCRRLTFVINNPIYTQRDVLKGHDKWVKYEFIIPLEDTARYIGIVQRVANKIHKYRDLILAQAGVGKLQSDVYTDIPTVKRDTVINISQVFSAATDHATPEQAKQSPLRQRPFVVGMNSSRSLEHVAQTKGGQVSHLPLMAQGGSIGRTNNNNHEVHGATVARVTLSTYNKAFVSNAHDGISDLVQALQGNHHPKTLMEDVRSKRVVQFFKVFAAEMLEKKGQRKQVVLRSSKAFVEMMMVLLGDKKAVYSAEVKVLWKEMMQGIKNMLGQVHTMDDHKRMREVVKGWGVGMLSKVTTLYKGKSNTSEPIPTWAERAEALKASMLQNRTAATNPNYMPEAPVKQPVPTEVSKITSLAVIPSRSKFSMLKEGLTNKFGGIIKKLMNSGQQKSIPYLPR